MNDTDTTTSDSKPSNEPSNGKAPGRVAAAWPLLLQIGRGLATRLQSALATADARLRPPLRRAIQRIPGAEARLEQVSSTINSHLRRLKDRLQHITQRVVQKSTALALKTGNMTVKELATTLWQRARTFVAGLRKQHIVAIGVLVALALWMLLMGGGGGPDNPSVLTDPNRAVVALSGDRPFGDNPNAVSVRAERVMPQAYVERVRVRGSTRAYRHVEVRAEVAGRVTSEPVPRGARVNTGDLLCQLALDSREQELEEARSRHAQSSIEYQGAVDLNARGLQSEVELARMKTALDSAAAALARAELAVEKTRIIAPFAGVVESREVEQGDLLNVGAVCASVLDDSPMLLVGLVPEQQVGGISLGNEVDAVLVDQRALSGKVSFIARAADPVSRSYRIEAEVDGGYNTVRDGITAEILVATAEVMAHLVPASALSFDDSGIIGVKTVDEDNRVQFSPVRIIADNTNRLDPGVWVSGLRGTVTLITVGQEVVFPGQQVIADFSWDEEEAPLQALETAK